MFERGNHRIDRLGQRIFVRSFGGRQRGRSIHAAHFLSHYLVQTLYVLDGHAVEKHPFELVIFLRRKNKENDKKRFGQSEINKLTTFKVSRI